MRERGARAARGTVAAYALWLVAVIVLFRFGGERWWVSGTLIFIPPYFWLLPLIPFGIVAALWHRRSLWGLGGCALLAVVGLFKYQLALPASPTEGAPRLKVVINNIGESNGTSVHEFVRRENPDLIVLQDCKRPLEEYRRLYAPPEWQMRREGQHLLISRFAIRKAALLPITWRRGVGASFEIDWHGRPVTVFSIHMPTPRPEFLYFFRQPNRYGTAPPPGTDRIANLRDAMRGRVTAAEALAAHAAAQPGPLLLVGDFNMPRWGALYPVFTRRFADAFETCGTGFGFTLSGENGNPLKTLGPWLRIDYLFCNRAWRPVSCLVEPSRPSQHRAMAAIFEWKEER